MSPRDAALLELDAKSLPGWESGLLEPRDITLPDPRDRTLCEHIVAGVVKNFFLLDYLSSHYSKRDGAQIEPLCRKILAIGLYQLRFLDRVPPSAAVDEAVKQTRRFGRDRAAGFVNAVLRNAGRDAAPPLPGAATDPAEYARAVLSHPSELFNRVAALIGVEAALAYCRHNNTTPPTILRLSAGVKAEDLAGEALSLRPHSSAGMFVVEGARQANLAEWAAAGLAQVQDPTAAAVVAAMGIQPHHRVMDRCCGMGTKTLQMLEATEIVAVDPSGLRCTALRRLLSARGISRIKVLQTAMLSGTHEKCDGRFDRILLDVPCSNSGVLARRAEARFAQDDETLASLARLQDAIVHDSADWVAPGGMMIYSTCSVWPAENQERIAAFLKARSEFELMDERITWPASDGDAAHYHDGGYVARLRRVR